ncbi:MAG: peptidoglycan DD-metalloendopeptidase family protein [Proteiniphilum sp.]|nr:peptidoglycan DD-metalloendopeptidase family protein [Proteiniphilum sp.]
MKKVVLITLLWFSVILLFSQTGQIESLQQQQQALQEEIKNTNRLYLDVKKQTTTILDRINLINKQISSRKALITVQRQEIEALRREESRLEREIARLKKELKSKQDNYANAMRGMLNNQYRQNKLLFILSGKSPGESLRRMQYLRDYSKWQKTQAEEIKKQNSEISAGMEALIKARGDREKALSTLENEQKRLQDEERARQTEISEARGKENQLQKTLQDKQRRVNQLNAQIEKLIAEEVARMEREAEAARRAEEAEARRRAAEEESRRKAAESATRPRRETESSKKTEEPAKAAEKKAETAPATTGPRIEAGRSTASGETFNLSKNFAANKGKLPLPVTGTASIVGNFGAKKHSEWNVTTNSNGIDIQAQKGANIRSVFEGEVSKVFSFPGSNTCVIVRHGEYYTFYANIYDLFVKQGDKVKTGQTLGRIYTDTDSGVSTMHFQLWQKTTKLNPAPWLKK